MTMRHDDDDDDIDDDNDTYCTNSDSDHALASDIRQPIT